MRGSLPTRKNCAVRIVVVRAQIGIPRGDRPARALRGLGPLFDTLTGGLPFAIPASPSPASIFSADAMGFVKVGAAELCDVHNSRRKVI